MRVVRKKSNGSKWNDQLQRRKNFSEKHMENKKFEGERSMAYVVGLRCHKVIKLSTEASLSNLGRWLSMKRV